MHPPSCIESEYPASHSEHAFDRALHGQPHGAPLPMSVGVRYRSSTKAAMAPRGEHQRDQPHQQGIAAAHEHVRPERWLSLRLARRRSSSTDACRISGAAATIGHERSTFVKGKPRSVQAPRRLRCTSGRPWPSDARSPSACRHPEPLCAGRQAILAVGDADLVRLVVSLAVRLLDQRIALLGVGQYDNVKGFRERIARAWCRSCDVSRPLWRWTPPFQRRAPTNGYA